MMPQPEEGKVRIKCEITKSGYTGGFARTGTIPCSEGFEARVWVRAPRDSDNDWSWTYTALVAKSIPVGKCLSKLESLCNKEDPSTWAYGIAFGNTPCNLTPTTDLDDDLPMKEPIKISYDRTNRKVTFTLGADVYTQTGLPEGIDFAIAVGLYTPPQESEVELVSVDGIPYKDLRERLQKHPQGFLLH